MIILVSQEWSNTAHNHAGISYQCDKMVSLYPQVFCHVKIPYVENLKVFPDILSPFSIKANNYIQRKRQNAKIHSYIKKVECMINKGDILFLMEYMDISLDYLKMAVHIRKQFPNISIYGLSHLVPQKLDQMFNYDKLCNWMAPIDKILTFGTSLTNYYKNRGINEDNIITTFDPVDNYYINEDIHINSNFSVLVMGNQMRDDVMLRKVVEANPDIEFKICQGSKNFGSIFKTSNVKLIPFVAEEVLYNYMKTSDVSLNIFKDVVGSTVISTSLGMGMAMICTDVGSIRDYCNDSNTLFCKSLDDYCNALQLLKRDKNLLLKMKINSNRKAQNITIDVYCQLLFSKFDYNDNNQDAI